MTHIVIGIPQSPSFPLFKGGRRISPSLLKGDGGLQLITMKQNMQQPDMVYKNISDDFIVLVWEFPHTFNALSNPQKSELYKLFLKNELVKITNNSDVEMYYERNKPYIKDHIYKSISISHTKNLLAIQLHKQNIAGIDIEISRPQLLKIQHKFLTEQEMNKAGNDTDILCCFWTAKEASFKIFGTENISLKNNINIDIGQYPCLQSKIIIHSQIHQFTLYSQKHNELTITYVVKKD